MNRRTLFRTFIGSLAALVGYKAAAAEQAKWVLLPPNTAEELNTWLRRSFDCREIVHQTAAAPSFDGPKRYPETTSVYYHSRWMAAPDVMGPDAERQLVRDAYEAFSPFAGQGYSLVVRAPFRLYPIENPFSEVAGTIVLHGRFASPDFEPPAP